MSNVQALSPGHVDVTLSDVPFYLRRGALYRNFGDDTDAETVSVPDNTIKPDLSIETVSDMSDLLTSLRFWGVDGVISEVVTFILRSTSVEGMQEMLHEFEMNFPYLRPLQQYLSNPQADLLRLVVQRGDQELLKYLHEGGKALSPNLTIFAAQQAHKSCLEYLFKHGCLCGYGALNAASNNGNIECFQLVLEAYLLHNPGKEVRWPIQITDANIDCFIFAYLNTPSCLFKAAILPAMMYKGVESIAYGHKHGLPLQSNQLILAVKNNDFEAFVSLHQLGCPWNIGVTTAAADQLKLNFLQYALQHGCRWNGGHGFATNAVRQNRLDCLQFAHAHGCYWSYSTCFAASTTGSLECLQFLHEHGCAWDVSALHTAVEKHHVPCVQYMLQEGCPWDKSVIYAAKRANNPCRDIVLAACGDIDPQPSKWWLGSNQYL